MLSSGSGTGATVRVLIESGDNEGRWGTVGVSQNVIDASWQALVDSIDFKLYKDTKKKGRVNKGRVGKDEIAAETAS